MTTEIKLIAGLANPGKEYTETRHNAGAWLVEMIAQDAGATLKPESKFNGAHAKATIGQHACHLLIPSTFMNLSGQAVSACMKFFKIPAESVLIVHDDIDLEPGDARIKFDGGAGGHNGLTDIINHLHTKKFYRLRIGVGHPGNSRDVSNYVLKRPSKIEKEKIDDAIYRALHTLPLIISGDSQRAMSQLHSQ